MPKEKKKTDTKPPAPAARPERVTVALAVPANRWIREEAQRRNWRMLHLWYCDHIVPDGVVLRGALVKYLPDDPQVHKLLEQGCKVVRVGNRPHPEDEAVPVVLHDFPAEGRLAAEHFAERSFQDVAYFGRDPWADGRSLYEAFSSRAQEQGITCHLYQFQEKQGESSHTKSERKEREFLEWLRGLPKPVGLLASGDWMAAKYCAWCGRAGVKMPDDVAILSRGNYLDICESTIPTISSLIPDEEARVRAACELLAQLMAGHPAPAEPILIPPKGIVERESTQVLATPDRVVAEALRYMWDHLEKDLSLEEVAGQVGLSGRQFARRFLASLGRNFTQELLRKRLEEARRLLRTTDCSIAEVASRVGFGSTTYLHSTFRKTFGMTPAQYRRERE